ncbi:MAG: hypothetical protein U9N30_10085, partial [Campylobacterota bacterium]|nr:hypothetical protein [Campylobacterota bacterium]
KALVIPMFDRDGNIVKYTSSRFLITEDEKHKQMLKKQILSHKTAGFSQYKKCQEEIQVALEMQEIDFKEDFVKIETTLHDVNQERKDLKRKLQGREKKIFELEDEVKRQMQRYESMQSQMHKKAQDEYSKNQDSNKNYDHLVIAKNKLEEDVNAGQYTIRKMQERIDEYIKRIDDLNDVIKSNGL